MTAQRKLILNVLRSTTSHPTADWIYHKVREQMPNISLGTVYRNLGLLADSGQILELKYSTGQSHYDGNPMPHYHFRCEECRRVYDLPLDYKPELDTQAKSLSSHRIECHRLEFFGTCSECQANACQSK